jgi:hypothetical protein
MKTKSFFILFMLGLLFVFSCGKTEDKLKETISKEELAFTTSSGEKSAVNDQKDTIFLSPGSNIIENEGAEDLINIEKQIIKTANISFGVKDYKSSKVKIDTIISKNKGYVSSENEVNSSYNISNTIVIRVPAENFSKLLADLEGEADQFESKSINTSDVTEEYIDIVKRLENKKKVEAQYIELLKKAYTISEILQVNEQIRILREEIEAKEGRLNYLKNQVGLSTITLYMHQDYSTVSYGFFHKIGEALQGGWQGFLGFLIALIYIWPLLLIGVGLFIFFRRRIKKRRAKKMQAPQV